MNVINVNINGMEYNLKGPESEEYLHKVARHVDKKLQDIMKGNSKLSISSAAVLTALNCADDMFKCDAAYEELQKDMEKLYSAEDAFKQEIESLKKQLKYLEEYNAELQKKLKSSNVVDVDKLSSELETAKDNAKKLLEEKSVLRAENKELKFQLQSYKYKTIELQHKLIEKGIDLAKEKKKSNPLLVKEL
jgi:cell division protein ZapA